MKARTGGLFAQLAAEATVAARVLLGVHSDFKLLTINKRIKEQSAGEGKNNFALCTAGSFIHACSAGMCKIFIMQLDLSECVSKPGEAGAHYSATTKSL